MPNSKNIEPKDPQAEANAEAKVAKAAVRKTAAFKAGRKVARKTAGGRCGYC